MSNRARAASLFKPWLVKSASDSGTKGCSPSRIAYVEHPKIERLRDLRNFSESPRSSRRSALTSPTLAWAKRILRVRWTSCANVVVFLGRWARESVFGCDRESGSARSHHSGSMDDNKTSVPGPHRDGPWGAPKLLGRSFEADAAGCAFGLARPPRNVFWGSQPYSLGFPLVTTWRRRHP